jgi:Tfp pilus assembly protein PilF
VKKHVLVLLPLLLLSCGALAQTDVNRGIEWARQGEYKSAAAALETAVEAGNVDPRVVESLYYSWTRQGEYAKARDKFESWATASRTRRLSAWRPAVSIA